MFPQVSDSPPTVPGVQADSSATALVSCLERCSGQGFRLSASVLIGQQWARV
jgi:hypothetical protein